MVHRVAPQAAADLDGIWYYVATESGSIEFANQLIDSITDRFFLLASHPYLAAPAKTTLALARPVFLWENT